MDPTEASLVFGLTAFVFFPLSNLTSENEFKSIIPLWISDIIWFIVYICLVVSGFYTFKENDTIYYIGELALFIVFIMSNKYWVDNKNPKIAIILMIINIIAFILFLLFIGFDQNWMAFFFCLFPYGPWIVWVSIWNIQWILSSKEKVDDPLSAPIKAVPPKMPPTTRTRKHVVVNF